MKRALPILLLALLPFPGLAAEPEAAVDALVPKLADPDVPKRYEAQMQLQLLASTASKPGNEAERAALGQILAARAADQALPQPARVWIVRQLEYMGRDEAVATLTQLLAGEDAELRECARRALQKNPAPGAGASLRAALEKAANETQKIGYISALGDRRDAEAVTLIAPELKDTKIGWAAAMALGQIATDKAVSALWSALPGNAFADTALIQAANRRLAAGDAPAAKAIYLKLNDASQPVAIRAAALSGLIKADPGAAADRVEEGLTSNEARMQESVINAAREALGPESSRVLAGVLPKASTPAKIQVLAVLLAPAEPAVITAAKDADEGVRVAALEALGRIGTAASVPVLLEAAASGAKPVKAEAAASLARVSGAGAAAAIRGAAAQGSSATRAAAITALAARNDTTARDVLAQYAGETDEVVRQAAVTALGKLGGADVIERLGKVVLEKKDAGALTALDAAAARVADKPAAAKQLLALAGSDDAQLSLFLNVFTVLGGPDALAAVTRLTASTNARTSEAAVRALSNWPDFAAVDSLLALARNPAIQGANYVLALAGAVRLVKTSEDQAPAVRAQRAVAILEAARGAQEKRLTLSLLGTLPDPAAAMAVKLWLSQDEFKPEAIQAGISLVKLLAKLDPASARDLAAAIKAASPDSAPQVDQALR